MIVKAIGEEAGFSTDKAHGVITFAIDSIAPITCDNPYNSGPATNGHFIGAHLRLSTAAAGADLSGAPSYINAADFSFVGSDGITVPGAAIATVATYGCLKDAEQFPSSPFAPGSDYVGTFVLDLPEEHGALIYSPAGGLSNGSGWEWDF
jgi:hypothetical protein